MVIDVPIWVIALSSAVCAYMLIWLFTTGK